MTLDSRAASKRTRRRMLGLVGLFAALSIILFSSRWGGDPPSAFSTSAAIAAAAQGPVPETLLACVERFSLEKGQTPAGALMRAGTAPDLTRRLIASLQDEVDIRAVRPEDTFTLYRSRAGEVSRLEYQRRPDERVVVVEDGETFSARRETIPVEVMVRHVEGVVEGSLWFAMLEAGGGAETVLKFSDLFAWDFDFTTDTRRGDRFDLLVEERFVEGQRIGYGDVLAGRYLPAGTDATMQVYQWPGADGHEGGYYDAEGNSVRRAFLKSPLSYRRISSGYSHNRRHPITKKVRPHLGVDYAAPTGTPIQSLGNGKITYVGWIKGFGKTIKVKHNATYLTQYAHLNGYARGMRAGVRVKQGDVIGYVGSTGMATGPHLDFRVQENGRWINPLTLKGGRAEPLPSAHRSEFAWRAERLRGLLDSMAPGGVLARGDTGLGGESGLASAHLDTPSGP